MSPTAFSRETGLFESVSSSVSTARAQVRSSLGHNPLLIIAVLAVLHAVAGKRHGNSSLGIRRRRGYPRLIQRTQTATRVRGLRQRPRARRRLRQDEPTSAASQGDGKAGLAQRSRTRQYRRLGWGAKEGLLLDSDRGAGTLRECRRSRHRRQQLSVLRRQRKPPGPRA